MVVMVRLRRELPLCLLASLAACAGHRVAGSMQVTANDPVILRVESSDPASIDVQIWNRGPDVVHFEEVHPQAAKPSSGVMNTANREHTWQATTRHFELHMTVKDGEASLGYVVRSDRGVSLTMGHK